jgi:hypothetical protein
MRAQLLRRERRAQQLDECEQWVGHHCVPAGYTVKLDDVETGLLFQFAADAAVEIDAAVDEVVTVERTARARSMSTGATTPAAPAISPSRVRALSPAFSSSECCGWYSASPKFSL